MEFHKIFHKAFSVPLTVSMGFCLMTRANSTVSTCFDLVNVKYLHFKRNVFKLCLLAVCCQHNSVSALGILLEYFRPILAKQEFVNKISFNSLNWKHCTNVSQIPDVTINENTSFCLFIVKRLYLVFNFCQKTFFFPSLHFFRLPFNVTLISSFPSNLRTDENCFFSWEITGGLVDRSYRKVTNDWHFTDQCKAYARPCSAWRQGCVAGVKTKHGLTHKQCW